VLHTHGDDRCEPAAAGLESRARATLQLDFARAVVAGLSDVPRWIPSRFLYDARGSHLFEEICRQPEYYLTRTETTILAAHAHAIHEATGPVTLIELGSGTSIKTSYLLDAYAAGGGPVDYVSVDVSEAALASAAERLAARHPTVRFEGIVGRYEEACSLFARHSPCLVLFLGSTIGNLNHAESFAFWDRVSAHLAPGDFFLLGADLVKDREILEAAYNDAAGVSAAFTKNLFARMNRELEAGLQLRHLRHTARYHAAWQRIEIFAHFERPQLLRVQPLDVAFELGAGEPIMTEISRKFVLPELVRYLAAFGLEARETFTDERRWFAVLLLERRRTP
jgi:L-histidine N-alpha-methyltransferase